MPRRPRGLPPLRVLLDTRPPRLRPRRPALPRPPSPPSPTAPPLAFVRRLRPAAAFPLPRQTRQRVRARPPELHRPAQPLVQDPLVFRHALFHRPGALQGLLILRLDDFAASFQNAPDVGSVLREHLRIRRQLRIISHRYRSFIVSILVFVTGSQFVVLFLTTRPGALVSWSNAGDLALCSIGLVTGLLICLHSAAKITHKAQAVTSHAATWHVCATIDSFDDDDDPEMPSSDQGYAAAAVYQRAESEDDDDESQSEDELDAAAKLVPAQFNATSFQKRQSLVTYLENNRAGITVFGFVVDRTWLHALFMIEFSLVMWMLGKTIGI
ncbi:uncharacterized protein A4U43_C03F31940 [Asparagus officinalis]|uniref:Uncharacterized protein n=1 Tax=Asparagus officinalis TaxID=4686 RepID=A0A5P1FIN7_ASPOF|nr:uncharacterized protein A4U43_C03F31940 [Asparagus officinalis]